MSKPMLRYLILFSINLFAFNIYGQSLTLEGEGSRIEVIQRSTDSYYLKFFYGDTLYNTYKAQRPITIEVDGKEINTFYKSCYVQNDTLLAIGSIETSGGSIFEITDKYINTTGNSYELIREVNVSSDQGGENYFNSVFGLDLISTSYIGNYDFFVPGIWYKNNFHSELPSGSFAADSNNTYYYFREDRLPLPLVALRSKQSGQTIYLAHVDANPITVIADEGTNRVINEHIQVGAIGVRQLGSTSLVFTYPGNEGERTYIGGRADVSRWANRSHPVKQGIKHHYTLKFVFGNTKSYSECVENAWIDIFEEYNYETIPVNIDTAFQGLINTLDYYFAADKAHGGSYDAPGFPFSVDVNTGAATGYNYQMGFIGFQIPNAYYLFREGFLNNDSSLYIKGESVLDFWSANTLTSLGLPRTWYDPSTGVSGSWRPGDNSSGGSAMRVCAGGMEGLLMAWAFAQKNKIDKPDWLNTCKKFGNWLVENQNEDGSFYLAYAHNIQNGKHNPTSTSKYTTTNVVRYLIELFIATDDVKYFNTAMLAGDFSLRVIHNKYQYQGSVIDNPNVIDRESGQMAIYAFLALYDLTGDEKWLQAAEQAALYTETWMFAYEIPAEQDRTDCVFPKDRSIVGQTIIASGHSAADLGLSFSAFSYYRLYIITGDDHYLKTAQLIFNNTKQSLNWDGSLYPGLQRGLQLEAFQVCIPRRRGVDKCLSWNYAANLDPLIRLQDAFGELSIDTIENYSWEQRQQLNSKYAYHQSIDLFMAKDTLVYCIDSVINFNVPGYYSISDSVMVTILQNGSQGIMSEHQFRFEYVKSKQFLTDTILFRFENKHRTSNTGRIIIAGTEILTPKLNVGAVSGSRIRVNWQHVSSFKDSIEYLIFRDEQLVNSTTLNWFIDSTVTENENYIYTIRAKSSDGTMSSVSNSVSVKASKGPIENNDFEFGDYLGWNSMGKVKIDNYAHSGLFATALMGNASLMQNLNLKPNYKYKLRISAFIENDKQTAQVIVAPINGEEYVLNIKRQYYKELPLSFITDTTGKVILKLTSNGSEDLSAFYDNITLEEIGEVDVSSSFKLSDEKINVIPNPFTNRFSISIPQDLHLNGCFVVTDMQGRRLLKIPAKSSDNIVVDASLFTPGMYFLHFISDGNRLIQKKLIKR